MVGDSLVFNKDLQWGIRSVSDQDIGAAIRVHRAILAFFHRGLPGTSGRETEITVTDAVWLDLIDTVSHDHRQYAAEGSKQSVATI